MRNQFRQRRRDLRWRMNRQMQDRRRLNMFQVERRVRHLEGRQEVVALDLENTHDLMKALEIKVNKLVDDNKRLKAQIYICRYIGKKVFVKPAYLRFWHWLRDVLCAKGKP